MSVPAEKDQQWMSLALKQAKMAAGQGEVPVGAVLVVDDCLVAVGYNHPITARDPSLHAEIDVLRKAGEVLSNYRLPGSTLYVTIEPCTMCVGAMIHARVTRLVFGAREPRAGAVASQLQLLDNSHYNHRIQWDEGVLAEQCAAVMQDFFRQRRRATSNS